MANTMHRFALLACLCVFIACGGGDEAPPDCASVEKGEVVPDTSNALFAYLMCEGYAGLTAEATPHRSAGPHTSGNVRTYVNATLLASLEQNTGEHPQGSAAIKVFLDSDDRTPTGFAVAVKNEAASRGGEGWYWYENFSATNNSPIARQGHPSCTGCHSGSDRDFFRTPFPLQ